MSDDVRSPFDDLEQPPPRRLAALAALVGGVLMVAVVAVLWGALTVAYGAEPFPWVAVVIVTGVPALLLAIGIDMTLRAFRTSSPGYWPIAGVTYLLVLIVLVTVLKVAESQYAEQTARMEAACSGPNVALLRSLPSFDGSVVSGDPAGDRTGACIITLTVQGGSTGEHLAHLTTALTADGWVVVDDGSDGITATRGSDAIAAIVGRTDDQGVTTIEVGTGSLR